MKKSHKRCQQRHEKRRTFSPAERSQRIAQTVRKPDRLLCSAVTLNGGPRPLRRQLQHWQGAATPLLSPMAHLTRERSALQPLLLLPRRKVGILNRQLG